MTAAHPLLRALDPRNANGAAEAMQHETIPAPTYREVETSWAGDPPVAIEAAVKVKRARKVATIAKRSGREKELADSTATPKWLADRLPHRDIDPCSNPRSHVRADIRWMLETGDDGLSEHAHWIGAAFLNNPFSAPQPWAQKAQAELCAGRCTDLIVLCKLDTSTKTWATITRAMPGHEPPELWLFHDRIEYDEHPELIEMRRLERVEKARQQGHAQASIDKITGESTANFVSCIIHHRGLGVAVLDLADVATRYKVAL